MPKIFINGLGRMGRVITRMIVDEQGANNLLFKDYDITGFNDIHPVANIEYLLKYDTAYGVWDKDVSSDSENDKIILTGVSLDVRHNGSVTTLLNDSTATDLITAADVFLDCTGKMTAAELKQVANATGARFYIACYPLARNSGGSDGVNIVAFGVNHSRLDGERTLCMASPDVQIIANIVNAVGADSAMDFFWAYSTRSNSNVQTVEDSYNYSKPALGRAAGWNIAPVQSSNQRTLGFVLPGMNGKCYLNENRALTLTGGVVNISAALKSGITEDMVFDRIRTGSATDMRNRNVYDLTKYPLVSSDAIKQPYAGIVLNYSTQVQAFADVGYANITAIYDNEYGQALQTMREIDYLVRDY